VFTVRSESAGGVTRRDFAKMMVGTVSGFALRTTITSAQAVKPNRSYISGVQFGLQPFCYHDLAMTPENRATLIQRLVRNNMGMVELHATWVEPVSMVRASLRKRRADSCATGAFRRRRTTTVPSRRSSKMPASRFSNTTLDSTRATAMLRLTPLSRAPAFSARRAA
jgi:hypothetical protein